LFLLFSIIFISEPTALNLKYLNRTIKNGKTNSKTNGKAEKEIFSNFSEYIRI